MKIATSQIMQMSPSGTKIWKLCTQNYGKSIKWEHGTFKWTELQQIYQSFSYRQRFLVGERY